jgi:lysosomal acid lipase/cholesteryl ester hydrolase
MGANEEELNVNENRPVVLLEHGAFSSSLSWLLNPTPENCLPLSLADEGFDVWLGNTRGSVYGNMHVSLNPTSNEFWNFTYVT